MKMYRKLLAVMMAASMLLTMLPPTAYAEEWEAEMTDPGDDMLVPDDGTEELDEDLGEDLVISDPDDAAADEYDLDTPADAEEDLLILDPDELEEEDLEEEVPDVPDEMDPLLDDDGSDPDLDLSDPDPSSRMPALILQDEEGAAPVDTPVELTMNTATAPFTLDVGETAEFSFVSEGGTLLFHAITDEEISLNWNITWADGSTPVSNARYSAMDASVGLGSGLTWNIYLTNADNSGPVELSLIVYPMVSIGVYSDDIPLFEGTDGSTATTTTAYVCPYVAAPMHVVSYTADTSKVWKLEDYTAYFDGWCDENGNIIRDNDFTSVPEGSKLTANWIKEVLIYLWSSSGNILDLTDPNHPVTLSNAEQITVPYGLTLGELNRMYKTETIDGMRFTSWNSDVGYSDESALLKNDYYCNARYNSDTYSSINIGETMSKTIEAGSYALMLFTPEHDGMYSFRAVADNDEASEKYSTISIRDDVTSALVTNDYSNFRNGPAITSAWLTGGKTYRAVITHNDGSIATTFTYSITEVLSVILDPNGGSIYIDYKTNYTATRVAMGSDSGTIADLTNAYACAGSTKNTFVGWALSKDASAPAADDLALVEGQTYYAVYESLQVTGELSALREWKSVTEPSKTSVMYSFTVPDGAADPYMIYFGIKAERITTLAIYDDNEQLLDQTYAINAGMGVPLSPGRSYLIKLSSTSSAGVSCELCAAEMSPVTLHSATAFCFKKDGTPADIVHGYYVPHAIELYGRLPDFYTNGYYVYYSSPEYYDYYFRGFGTDPDGPALSDEELDALSGQYTDLYIIAKRQIKVCLDPGEAAAVYDLNDRKSSSYQWIDEGTSIHDLNTQYQGRKGDGIDYAFVGWADSPDATEPLPETDRIRTDITLYAIYTEQTFEPLAVNTPKTVTLDAGYSKWFRMTTGSSSRSIHYLLYVTAESKGLRANVYNENGNLVGFAFRSNEKNHEIYKYLYLEPETTYLIEVNTSKDCSLMVGAETLWGITADACGGKVSDDYGTYEDTFYTEVSPHKGIAYGWTIEPPKEHTFLGWTATEGSHTLLSTEDELPAEGSTVYAAYDGTHTYGDFVVTKQPTALQTGSKYHICKVCGYKETTTIAKLTPVLKFNVTSLQMQKAQVCKKVTVSMAKDDYIKSWKSSNTAIVKVTGTVGTTTANKTVACTLTAGSTTGTAYITVTLASGKTGKIPITVQSGNVVTTALKLTAPKPTTTDGKAGSVTIVKNNTYAVKVTRVAPFTANDTLKYASTNTAIATVTSKGMIKGMKNGTCKVYVKNSANKVLATVNVTVKSSIKLNAASLTLQKKQIFKGFKVTMTTGDYVTSWKSSNTNIFTVSGGIGATNGKAGTCTITAKAPAAASSDAYLTVTLHSGLSKKIKVTVRTAKVTTTTMILTAPVPTNTAKTVGKATVSVGKTYTIKVTRAPITTQDTVTYTSSNKTVATVTSTGVIKGIKAGTCKITIKSGTKLAYVTVTVK